MIVSILILEETLGIESLSVDQEHELLLHFANVGSVNVVWLLLAVEGLGSGVVEGDVD